MKNATAVVMISFVSVLLMAASPYPVMKDRSIKAISSEKIEALQYGRGAGYALAAELNGYPGPRHVLELADKLDLSPDQRRDTQRLFDRMKQEAVHLGSQLLTQEADLEKLFRSRTIDEPVLFRLTGNIGAIDAKLRATHLKYHLAMARLLTAHQRANYDRLRGYNTDQSRYHAH